MASKLVSSHGTVNDAGIANELLDKNAVTSLVEKSDWNVRIWEPKNCSSNNMIVQAGNRGHLSLIFESISHTEWRPFTIELALRGEEHDKISLYSYIFDNVKKYGLSGRIEVLPAKNDSSIKSSFIVKNKSVDDLEFLAKSCIKQWRWYSLLFFNCRNFVHRFSLHLQKESKRFGYLLPYIPVLYDDWFISLSIASGFAVAYALSYEKVFSLHSHESMLGNGSWSETVGREFLAEVHRFTGYATFVFIFGALCIGSVQLMHQKHDLNIKASNLKNEEEEEEDEEEKEIEEENKSGKQMDRVYLATCGVFLTVGAYYGVKYLNQVGASIRFGEELLRF